MKLKIPTAEVYEPLLVPARFKGAHGGRGSGKSYFFADASIVAMLSGLNVLCIREIQNSIADSVKRLIEGRIEQHGLEQWFRVTDKEIRCPLQGSVAIFRGMQNHTAASIKSLEGFDRAWWEEAQTASQRSLDLLIPTIRTAGSELWFSWNPGDESDPIEFLRKAPPEGAIIVEANWHDNPWFPDELRSDMERDRRFDPEKAAHVWDGEFAGRAEARVFRNWSVGELDEVPDNIVWFYGCDWGFANDPTAGLRVCFPDDETAYVDAEVYEIGAALERHPMLLNGLPNVRQWPLIADSARPETIDYVRRHGFPRIRAARKGKGSVEHGVEFLRSYRIVIHPRCVNLEYELKNYAYKRDPRTEEVLPVIEDRNNHLIDALRYATEGLHRKGKRLPVGQTPKERRDDYGFDEQEERNWKTA